MKPFLILGLPRSMTAWLANWFTYGNTFCYHEGSLHYDSLSDLIKLSDNDITYGDSNSGIPLHQYNDLLNLHDNFTIGYVKRDINQVIESYSKVNPDPKINETTYLINRLNDYLVTLLDKIEHFKINYEDILNIDVFQEFHSNIVPMIPFNEKRYDLLKDVRITQKVEQVYKREVLSWEQ